MYVASGFYNSERTSFKLTGHTKFVLVYKDIVIADSQFHCNDCIEALKLCKTVQKMITCLRDDRF